MFFAKVLGEAAGEGAPQDDVEDSYGGEVRGGAGEADVAYAELGLRGAGAVDQDDARRDRAGRRRWLRRLGPRGPAGEGRLDEARDAGGLGGAGDEDPGGL